VDEPLFLAQMQSMQKRRAWYLFLFFVGISATTEASAPDTAAQEAAGIVAGLQSGAGGKVIYNETTDRVEVRDEQGSLVDEIVLGTASKAIDVAGQEYRLSFGKDENSRRSVLVRPGPAMQRPVTLEVLGRKAVLSPEASLLATLGSKDQVFYEPSICGEVYYIEGFGGAGNRVSRLATQKREVAVLAKPSNPTGAGPGSLAGGQADDKSMEKAGDTVKSAFCAVLGLPDKQPSTKAKVYRLKGNQDPNESAWGGVAPPVSAEAGSH
jgi:hypothetical protein